eukprot:m.101229 g.101229  ORF g.101229 m.101229 type:complete len:286 (+) comp15650_c0_seq1:52-909(+)
MSLELRIKPIFSRCLTSALGEDMCEYVRAMFVELAEQAPPANEEELEETVRQALEGTEAEINVADMAERICLELQAVGVAFGTEAATSTATTTTTVVGPDGKMVQVQIQTRDLDVPVGESEPVMALLEEDGEWHEALVQRQLGPGLFAVRFVQFNKVQETARDGIVLMEDLAENDDGSSDVGACEMCDRQLRLTRHHLIPRTMHAKYAKLGHTKQHLSTTVSICRACHNVVHRLHPEDELAAAYHTLDLILADAGIQKWIAYARTSRKETKWDMQMNRQRPARVR